MSSTFAYRLTISTDIRIIAHILTANRMYTIFLLHLSFTIHI